MNLVYNAKSVPKSLMYGALNQQDMLCRVFGACRFGDVLDSEVGNFVETASTAPGLKLFTYLRYNATLSERGLTTLGLADLDWRRVSRMDSVEQSHLDDLARVGAAVAARVQSDHFDGFDHPASGDLRPACGGAG